MNKDWPSWLKKAFSGRSVFVTGHTGFKGSWLCLWLEQLGARVTGYALAPPTEPNNFTTSAVREVLTGHHEAEIRDPVSLTEALREAQPEVIFHLAAQSIVRQSYRLPRETFDVNILGTATLLDAVRALGLPCSLVAITSDKCYENKEQVWGYRETDEMGGHDPYSASKGAAELLISSYRRSFFPPGKAPERRVKLASCRAGNVIGGGDWTPDALIVDAVQALARRESIQVRSPQAVQPWQHVLNALSGYLTLAATLLESEDPALCSGWNLGPAAGQCLSVREVVELLIRYWGSGSWTDGSDANSPYESHLLMLCIDKVLWRLRWKPIWDTEEAVAKTAEWYHRYFAGEAATGDICREPILSYQGLMASLGEVSPAATPSDRSIPPAGIEV